MKKIILPLLLLMLVTAGYSQVTLSDPTPKFGCPNTTHDITLSVTNSSIHTLPPGITYNMDITVYTNTATVLSTFSQSYSDGFASGGAKSFTITAIPFVGAMPCSIAVTLNAPSVPIIGSVTYNTSGTYVVQYPPDLTITETPVGTLAVTNASSLLSTYYVSRLFLNANYTSYVNESAGTFTPPLSGSYTVKAYDPISECYSENPSNAIALTVTSTKEGQLANVSVYPNPISNNVTISSELANTLHYELSDINGAVLKNDEFTSVTNVSVENLIAGTYFLKVKDQNNKTATYKLVK